MADIVTLMFECGKGLRLRDVDVVKLNRFDFKKYKKIVVEFEKNTN